FLVSRQTAPPARYTPSLHDALPISTSCRRSAAESWGPSFTLRRGQATSTDRLRSLGKHQVDRGQALCRLLEAEHEAGRVLAGEHPHPAVGELDLGIGRLLGGDEYESHAEMAILRAGERPLAMDGDDVVDGDRPQLARADGAASVGEALVGDDVDEDRDAGNLVGRNEAHQIEFERSVGHGVATVGDQAEAVDDVGGGAIFVVGIAGWPRAFRLRADQALGVEAAELAANAGVVPVGALKTQAGREVDGPMVQHLVEGRTVAVELQGDDAAQLV